MNNKWVTLETIKEAMQRPEFVEAITKAVRESEIVKEKDAEISKLRVELIEVYKRALGSEDSDKESIKMYRSARDRAEIANTRIAVIESERKVLLTTLDEISEHHMGSKCVLGPEACSYYKRARVVIDSLSEDD